MARTKSMPFPGESPTISLALAAGHKYGLKEGKDEQRKPARATQRKATKKKARAR